MFDAKKCGTWAAIAAAALLLGAAATASAASEIVYVSGLRNAEDLVPIPDTRWIISSGMREENHPGALYLLDRVEKRASVLFPIASIPNNYDARAYPGCPDPVDGKLLSAHGLSLRKGANGIHTLYVVNHGAREAVEVFEVNATPAVPTLVWKGCVLLPAGGFANSVAPLPNGGIAVTIMAASEYFAEPGAAFRFDAWTAKFKEEAVTGYVVRWSAANGWKIVPGTEASGPNGLEVSPDGRWLWVANWANRQIVRVPLTEGAMRAEWELDFMPDNVRWGDDGALWTVGHAGTPAGFITCAATPGCKNDYGIARIDPRSEKLTRVAHPNTAPDFTQPTVALQLGKELWIGAYPADRVAIMRLED